jgi:Ulp1 family protease
MLSKLLCSRKIVCRELTAEHQAKYAEVTADKYNETTAVTHEDQKVEVAFAHLATCARNKWLADPIINVYMALLQARACLH